MAQYEVVPGSVSGHCCFEASVVDTTRPHSEFSLVRQVVCECFHEEDANLVAEALNAIAGGFR